MNPFRPALWAAPVAALLAAAALGQDKPRAAAKPPTVMQRKLTHAHNVLIGLALPDFDKVTTGADELAACAREASWRVLKTPKYERYSDEFLRTLDDLKAAAKKKNVDAAALAYVDMTLTCVKCHQHARDVGWGPPRTSPGTGCDWQRSSASVPPGGVPGLGGPGTPPGRTKNPVGRQPRPIPRRLRDFGPPRVRGTGAAFPESVPPRYHLRGNTRVRHRPPV